MEDIKTVLTYPALDTKQIQSNMLLTCYCFVQKYFFRATNGYQQLAILNRVLLHIFRYIISFLNDINPKNIGVLLSNTHEKYTVCNII